MDQLTISVALQMARERNDQLTRESETRLHRPPDHPGNGPTPGRPSPEATPPGSWAVRRPRFTRGAAATQGT